jgi:putative ABC transport system ATP-binding protein
MSRDTLRMLGEADTGQRVGPLMVEIRDPARAEIVAAQLNKKGDGKFRAWTRQELADANSGAMLDDQIIGIMLGFSAFLGLLIGVAITWQTLRGAIMANIKEFASLRALGVSMGDLRNIVMELSFWVGIAGVFAAGLLTWLVTLLATAGGVPMYFPPDPDRGRRGVPGDHRRALRLPVAGHPEEQPTGGPAAMSNDHSHKRGQSALSAQGIVKRFKTGRTFIEVLKGVDFDAKHGDVTMVMGPSGSGKSTLVAALSGLLKPDEGKVSALEAKDLWSLSSGKIDKFRLDHCGFIFQGFNLFPALTAKQQVMTVLKYQDIGPGEASRRAQAALESVGLGPRVNQRPSELSGGEKQRVAIARALAKNPNLIFADEPTSALDGKSGETVIKLLRAAATERGAAVICVTHDPRLEAYADRVIHIEDGRILDDVRRTPDANPAPLSH